MRYLLPILFFFAGCTNRQTEDAHVQESFRRTLNLDQGWNQQPWIQQTRTIAPTMVLRTTFSLDELSNIGGSELVLEQLWWEANITINGHEFDSITGGNAPTRLTIGEALVDGENSLEIRIQGPTEESPRETGGWLVDESHENRREPALRTAPRIELHPATYISSLDLPLDGENVQAIAHIVGVNTDLRIRFIATQDGTILKDLGVANVDENGTAQAQAVPWNGPLWAPQEPALIVLTGILEDSSGKEIDRWSRRVGVRQVRVGTRSLEINGEPTPLMAARAVTRPQVGSLEERLPNWANGGVNAIEVHGESISEQWLSMADELGIPVILLPRCIGRANQHDSVDQALLDLLENQDQRLLEMTNNHPSVVLWMTEGQSQVSRNNHRSIPLWTDVLLTDPHDRPIVDHDLSGGVLQVNPMGASCNTGSCQGTWIAEITGQGGGPSPWAGMSAAYLQAIMGEGAFGGTIPTGQNGDQTWARTWSVLGTALGVNQMSRGPHRSRSSVRISGLEPGQIAWLEAPWTPTIGGIADEDGTLVLSTWYVGEATIRTGAWEQTVEMNAGYWEDFRWNASTTHIARE